MKKRIISVMMISLLACSIAVGNGVSEDAATVPADVDSHGTQTIEVNFFHTAWVPGMLEILKEAIEDFESANPGIKIVETRTNWTDAPSQLMTSIMGGTPPDFVMCNPPMVAQFRNIGAFADLSGRVSQKFLDSLLPSARAICTTLDGKIDGLPQEGCNWALFYRKDLFEQAGLDPNKPPKNWDELVAYSKKLAKDTDGDGVIDRYGYGWPVAAENATDYWINFMQQAGAKITSYEDGKWTSHLLDPEAVNGTEYMVNLVKDGCSPKAIVGWDWEAVTNAFVAGDIAMMHNGAWVVNSVKEKGPELDGKWGTAVLFDGPAGSAYRGHPNTFHIMKASKYQDEAWEFLEFFYNTPCKSNPDLTYAGAFCNASGGMLYTRDFVEYARKHYEPLLLPFLDVVDGCKIPPMDPDWQTLTSMFGQSKIQQMLMGDVSVKDGLTDLDENLKLLHGEK